MPTMLLALPIVPGQTEAARAFGTECMGPRYDEYDDSMRRIGLHAEYWYLLHLPAGGDHLMLHLEGPDPATSVNALAISQEPFDAWFTQRLFELTGVAISHVPPELIAGPLVDYTAIARVE